MTFITNALKSVDSFLWGLPMIIVLFGTHIFLTFKTGFIQKKYLKE